MNKALKVVLLIVGLIVVSGIAAVFLLDPQAYIEAKKDEVLKDVSAKLGRTLSVGQVKGSVIGGLHATVDDVRLAGPTPDAKPQAAVKQVDLRMSLWKAITSFGKILEV